MREMDWFERRPRWQRVCATLSLIGLVVTAAWGYYTLPQVNTKLVRQLTATECQAINALPAEQTNPNTLSKEHYALYMQCDELFWYRARHPDAPLTLAEYQDQLKKERQRLIVQALLYWLGGVVVLFAMTFVLVQTFASTQRDTDANVE
jgi:hypothetical protein